MSYDAIDLRPSKTEVCKVKSFNVLEEGFRVGGEAKAAYRHEERVVAVVHGDDELEHGGVLAHPAIESRADRPSARHLALFRCRLLLPEPSGAFVRLFKRFLRL